MLRLIVRLRVAEFCRPADKLLPQLIELNPQRGIIELRDAAACQHHNIPTAKAELMAKTFAGNAFDAITLIGLAHVFFRNHQAQARLGVAIGAGENQNFFRGDF